LSTTGQHILVIRLSAMGDVAMTVPVLRIVLDRYPHLHITVVTRKSFLPFFQGIDRLNVHIADFKGIHKGIWGLRKLAQEINYLNIDAIADLHDVLRSKAIRFFLPNSIKTCIIDKGRTEKSALTRQKNKIKKQLKTTHQRYADVFELLGCPVDLSVDLPIPQRNIAPKTEEILERLCPSIMEYSKWIGIAPFAKHQGKMYPIDLMEEVIATLAEKSQLIVLFGGPEEYGTLQAIDNQYANVINIAGKISLSEELALIQRLEYMISMDSANMHMASLVGTRVISIWGATHPYAGFMGWRQSMNDALVPNAEIYPDLPCSVYGNKVYSGYEECMRSIEPEEIVHAVMNLSTKSHH